MSINLLLFTKCLPLHFPSKGCDCNVVGSNNPGQCERNGGQCSCKPNVIGRTCEACRPDYFNFNSSRGCEGEIVVIENSHTRFSLKLS